MMTGHGKYKCHTQSECESSNWGQIILYVLGPLIVTGQSIGLAIFSPILFWAYPILAWMFYTNDDKDGKMRKEIDSNAMDGLILLVPLYLPF